MELLIVTGMSGAGKSKAINAMEDIGYNCIDNIPAKLLEHVVLLYKEKSQLDAAAPMAVVMDIRSGNLFDMLFEQRAQLQAEGHHCRIVFLDCSDSAIIHRYQETRRRHPLVSRDRPRIEDALIAERSIMEPVKNQADHVIDTTLLTTAQLKERIASLFAVDQLGAMIISCNSFGFKYGVPPEADMVFDLRCLPNPFYQAELKDLTGLDKPVQDFVLSHSESAQLLQKIIDLIAYLLPLYKQEGRSQLNISIGCTGGRHRSVTFAQRLYTFMQEQGYAAIVYHRDIAK